MYKRTNKTKFSFFNKKLLIDLYINKNLSTTKIAEKYGCCEPTILFYLKKYNIKTRPSNTEIAK